MCSSCILSKAFVCSFLFVFQGFGTSKQSANKITNEQFVFTYQRRRSHSLKQVVRSHLFAIFYLIWIQLYTRLVGRRAFLVPRFFSRTPHTYTHMYTHTHIVQQTAIEFCRLVLHIWKRYHLAPACASDLVLASIIYVHLMIYFMLPLLVVIFA